MGKRIVSTEILSPLVCGSTITFFFLLPLFSSMKSVTQPETQGGDVQCAARRINSASGPRGSGLFITRDVDELKEATVVIAKGKGSFV